jgi:DUF4097 and DUF4098 domain-containing protein YvlB
MRRCAFLVALMAALFSLGGCFYVGDWESSDAFKEDFHSTHPLSAGGRVSVESFNGSIDLTGWEQNSVEVNGTKYASSRNALDDLKIDINSTADSIRIRAVRPSDLHFRMGVRFSIRVPHKALLEMISSSNGKIQIEDVEGKTRLHTSNGAVRVSRLKGDLEARTSNGSIEARDVEGNVDFHTSNGSIRAEGIRGSLEAVSSNGSIIARLTDPARNWPVRVESSNGHVELTLDGKQLPDVRASTSNSSILIRLPATANARVRAHTSHSAINSEFDELHSEGRHRSEMEGTIGSGGPLIELSTHNGGIKIQKL